MTAQPAFTNLLAASRGVATKWSEADHIRGAVAAAPLRGFAVPHLVVDDVFTKSMLARINDNWPDDDAFEPEVKGNYILQMYRSRYTRIAEAKRQFWQTFNETFWPIVVSAAAEALAGPATEVFGDLYSQYLMLGWPLTLMQAKADYAEHHMHTHFWNDAHWAFTMLLYIDPEDTVSRGTALHRLLPVAHPSPAETSYVASEIGRQTDVVMHTRYWEPKPEWQYEERVCQYRANRLFVFLDGPLALHSVPRDNLDGSPDPRRALDGGRHARRRVLRTHAMVHPAPFYSKHGLDLETYRRVMWPKAPLSTDDERYRDAVILPFIRERLGAHERGAALVQMPLPLRQRFARRLRPAAGGFEANIIARIPQ